MTPAPTATSTPLDCAPGGAQMSAQNNDISIQVAAGTSVVGTASEKILQVGMHDQNPNKQLIRDQARILPLGKDKNTT